MGSAWGELGVLEECGEISLTWGGQGVPGPSHLWGSPPNLWTPAWLCMSCRDVHPDGWLQGGDGTGLSLLVTPRDVASPGCTGMAQVPVPHSQHCQGRLSSGGWDG